MTILWINLASVYLISSFARYFSKPNMGLPDFVSPNRFLAIMAGVFLVLVSGLRKNIGDTIFYMHSYAENNFTWENIKGQKDIGFNIFQMYLQKFSHDPQVLVFTVSLITNVLIIVVLYRYTRLFELGLYVYFTTGLYITGMNGIRQFLAAAIVFSATKYLINGDWKKYFFIILIAAQIHNTAYILIPIYFMVRRKAWSKSTFLILAVAVLLVIGYSQFSSALFSALQDTQYAGYQNGSVRGANFLRVPIYGMPILLAYLGREKLKELCPYSDYIINMSILGLVFMVISTQDWIFARFTYYFGLYSLIIISWIPKFFREKDQKTIYYVIIIFYLFNSYYENVISLGLVYKSDFLPW